MKQYKLLSLFIVLNVTFQLVSDVTAGKIVEILSFPVSVTVLFFPFVYVISDVLTEVYGYAQARRVLWLTMIASILAGVVYQVVLEVPPAAIFGNNEAYELVFSTVPRVLIGGWVAVFAGEMVNNYILAKMKVWTKGEHLWLRIISSTIGGQFINTALFYTIALSGILPTGILVTSILAAWTLKVLVEIVLTPFTYMVIKKVKEIEIEDYFDTDTNFAPLKY